MNRRIEALAVAAFMAFTMAWSGSVLAGDKAPEQGTWEFQAALESGSLPMSNLDAGKEAKDVVGKTAVDESGGTVYRVGIDTP